MVYLMIGIYDIIIIVLLCFNILCFIIGYLFGKINNSNLKVFSKHQNTENLVLENINIDEGRVVTKISTEGYEKKYETIGTIKESTENINTSINKLKNLKHGR